MWVRVILSVVKNEMKFVFNPFKLILRIKKIVFKDVKLSFYLTFSYFLE